MRFFLVFWIFPLFASEGVESFLDQFERPATVLEIGRRVSQKISSHYPQHLFVLWDKKGLGDHNCIVLSANITTERLARLAECEHFDLVIANRYDEHYQSLGDHLLVPYPDDPFEQRQFNRKYQLVRPKLFGGYVLFEKKRDRLVRNFWSCRNHSKYIFKIHANFKEKCLVKSAPDLGESKVKSEWIPGINLISFKHLKGTYPTYPMIKSELSRLQSVPHGDWMLNNMIVVGDHLTFIDRVDPRRCNLKKCGDKRLRFFLKAWKLDDLALFTQMIHHDFFSQKIGSDE